MVRGGGKEARRDWFRVCRWRGSRCRRYSFVGDNNKKSRGVSDDNLMVKVSGRKKGRAVSERVGGGESRRCIPPYRSPRIAQISPEDHDSESLRLSLSLMTRSVAVTRRGREAIHSAPLRAVLFSLLHRNISCRTWGPAATRRKQLCPRFDVCSRQADCPFTTYNLRHNSLSCKS